jgi:hypothetical protein
VEPRPSGIKPLKIFFLKKIPQPNPAKICWFTYTHTRAFFFGYQKPLFSYICLSGGRPLIPLGVFFAAFLAARDRDKSPGFTSDERLFSLENNL